MLSRRVLFEDEALQVAEFTCTYGPRDPAFEEENPASGVSIVIDGSFQFRREGGTRTLLPGSVMLTNARQCFVCSHEHGTGDRCLSFAFTDAARFRLPALPPNARALAVAHHVLDGADPEEWAYAFANELAALERPHTDVSYAQRRRAARPTTRRSCSTRTGTISKRCCSSGRL